MSLAEALFNISELCDSVELKYSEGDLCIEWSVKRNSEVYTCPLGDSFKNLDWILDTLETIESDIINRNCFGTYSVVKG